MLKSLKKKILKKFCVKKPLREVVLVFPFDTKEKKLLIMQEYIHHYKRAFWKITSGGVDKKGKDLITHAREELAEELGLEANNMYHLYSSEKVFGARGLHAYIAENPIKMKKPPINPDTDEVLQTKWITESEFWQMIENRELLWNESAIMAAQVFRKFQ
ncbi:MAG: NUDIX domain-containing protein [Candidatus Pacebacteria bacterium]|nr:NUDIX domain-containing protein [Candidatus Paceibacterota bacterium]